MKDEWFSINDLDQFTDKVRKIVYNNFGCWKDKTDIDILIDDVKPEELDELEKVLSKSESILIVKELLKKEKHKKTNKIRYILNDDVFAEIVHKLNERMVSNIINSLVNKGLVESGYDSETNDFVFWVKDNEKEKPETD